MYKHAYMSFESIEIAYPLKNFMTKKYIAVNQLLTKKLYKYETRK